MTSKAGNGYGTADNLETVGCGLKAKRRHYEVRRNKTTLPKDSENQLDALYSAEAMDLTDVEVLDSILKART